MKTKHLAILISAVLVLVIVAMFWAARSTATRVAEQAKHAAVVRDEGNRPLPKGQTFTRVQANDFLNAAKRAEAIADTLQRCLAYPDPPGSHWHHEVVVAYCKYRHQPTISFAQVRQLIQAGRTDELDRLFEAALQAQMTDPDAPGRLDETFIKAFAKASFDIRSTLDAWKRQSPDSAFAFAASGFEYERMAVDARGTNYISKTPQSAIDSMDRLALQADTDLRRGLALNPKITPAYVAMISLGGMTLGRKYALAAAQRGLAQDPANYYIYWKLMWFEQPNWYGSLDAMAAVARKVQQHADRNPLLRVLASSRGLYRIEKCDCAAEVKLSAYEAVLDQFSGTQALIDAGYAAKDANDPSAMTIYLSEALRFDPDLHDTRIDRIYGLVEFDRIRWAIAEANRLIAASSDDGAAVKARGWAHLIGNDLPQARKDFETAVEIIPDDQWVLAKLSSLYMGNRQWDKAWNIANRVILKNPQEPDGWVMRAQIQLQQPRPGLKETTDYLDAHFNKDKKNLQLNSYIAHLRTVLQQRAKTPQ